MVNEYIKEMEIIEALEQEDRANGAVGFFAEVVPSGADDKKKAFKAGTLTEALAKAEGYYKEGEMPDLSLTLWHVEGGAMREVGAFSRSAEENVWMHEYREEKQLRPLVYTCKLRKH